jgi:periplasmic divalent cation tolerance protein
MKDSTELIFVYMTVGTMEEARKIAHQLVHNKLAACCNLIPGMVSFYRWQDQVEEGQEIVLIAKTQKIRFAALQEFVMSIHSYECPCIVTLPIGDGHEKYLNWLIRES